MQAKRKVGSVLLVVVTGIVGLVVAVLATAWVAGQARVSLVSVYTELEIDAPKETVWAVISGFDKYAEWNPLMVEARATVAAGQRMDWTSRLDGVATAYNARIDTADINRELSWTGPISSFGRISFWGHHSLIIEEVAPGRVKLINKEGFGGIMTIPYSSYLKSNVRSAYDGMNAAVKARAEQLAASR